MCNCKKTGYLYSYRLTHFGGAAPCYQNDALTLAICKKDMRRVIGREFLKNGDKKDIWFAGMTGDFLVKNGFRDTGFRSSDILYIARVTDVQTFAAYFSDVSHMRKDKIYMPLTGKTEDPVYYTEGQAFVHRADDQIHNNRYLWNKDWDVAHQTDEKYVLISDQYCFLNREQSELLTQTIVANGGALCKRIGHKPCQPQPEVFALLENIVVQAKEHGMENLPEHLRK